MRTCSNCGLKLEDNNNFCTMCGKPIHQRFVNMRCPNCGFDAGVTARFCSQCGQSMTQMSASGKNKCTFQEHTEILEEYIVDAVRKGWMVESQGNFQAVMVGGRKVDKWPHPLLTFVSLGLWRILLLLGGIESKDLERMIIQVDEWGNASLTKV